MSLTNPETAALRLFTLLANGQGYLWYVTIASKGDSDGTRYSTLIRQLVKKGRLKRDNGKIIFLGPRKA